MKTISSFSSKLLALTLALMASVSTFAYDFQSGYLFYNILPDGTVAVTSETYGMPYDYLPTSLVIPSEVTGYNGETYIVTEIANYAFSGCSMLDTLVIPNTVKKIGMYAFTGCTKLVYISFPESIEDILGGALYECAWYNNQPDGLIYIGNLLYRYKGTAPTGTIVVKDGTKAILDFTFSNQPNIQSVVLPESVTSIHIQAFGDCPNLESVVLPSKLEAIEDHTFQYCEKLTNIKLPDALKLIGKNAFIGCANLTKLTLPSSVQIIEDEAFANCTSLTEVTCYATIPPVRGDVVSDSPSDWFFDGVEVSKIPLYVPAESIDLYKEAEQWMFFNPILPIEPSTSYKSQWCNKWNVMWFDGMYFDETASTTKYRLGKDTIIGDYTYSKFTSSTSVRFTNDRKVYVYYEGFDDNDPYSEDLPTGEYLAYDFSAQVGDTLEVFSGVTYNTKTYKCVVYDVQTDPETNLRTIMLHPLRVVDGNGNVEVSSEEITWIEGVGSPRGFLIGTTLPGGGLYALLCAYKGDELKYTGSLYDEYGCEYNATEQNPEDLFPTLTGLQRTEVKVHTTGVDAPHIVSFDEYTHYVPYNKQKIYLTYDRLTFLREENNQVLLYAPSYGIKEDVVLYDWTLEVGDTLPYNKYTVLKETDFIVTNVSTITLLDGKEYKKWTLACGIEYIEGIGAINGGGYGNYFCLQYSESPAIYIENRLVCASRNGQLLYQMDDAEMERLGTECLCEVEKKWSDTWCDTWNIMEHNVQLIGDYNEETWRHYLAEDTTINGTTYTTVNRYWTADKTKRGFVATIRFTEDQKVYALLGDTEYLVYDFYVQVGDTIETIVGVNCGTMLQRLLVHQVDIDDATNRKTITLYPLCKLEEDVDCDRCDENGYYLDLFPIQWIEGVGSTGGFLMGDRPCSDWVGGIGHKLLCAYKDDELQYINDLYQDDYGCEYNAVGQNPENLFPTLWGLQRTVCNEYCGDTEDDNSANFTYKQTFDSIFFENDKPYILCNGYLLREEDNKIFLYSQSLNKDIVLYDFTLEVGDSLPALYIDYHARNTMDWMPYNPDVVDYNKDFDGTMYSDDTLVVTDISSVTLLDGKEYKKWTFDNGMEYVEGIGMYGGHRNGNFFGLIQEIVVPCHTGTHLVCVSKNGKLLYMMDNAEMERLGTECLCEVEKKWSDTWCDTWNVLDLKYRTIKYTTKEDFETWRYYLAQDTIINNYTYTAVTRQTTKVPEGVYPFTIPEPEYVAAVRFTDDRKVYIYYDNTEYLLYDFNVQPGDELTVFAGINHYHSHHTNTIRVAEVERYPGIYPFGTEISLSVFPDFYGDERPTCFGVTKWVEGVGDLCGFITGADCGLSEYQTALLCAYKDGYTEYTTEYEEYAEYGCEYNSGENKEYILTLPGLQRTVYDEFCGEAEIGAVYTGKQTFDKIFFENDKPYILCNDYLLHEEDNKILIYSQLLNKDLVLYDFTLEVGDSLPALYIDYHARNAMDWMPYNPDVVDYNKDFDGTIYPADTFVVTDVSNITLLDGKEYKKWTFDNGMEYVEGIGMYGGHRNGNFFGLIQEIVVPCHTGTHLVCVSKNGKLLYQMDDAEMERLGAECLCDVEKKWSDTWCNQWNILSHGYQGPQDPLAAARTSIFWLSNNTVNRDGQEYIPLMCSSSKPDVESTNLIGELRFTEDKQVYFYYDNTEYLLYDFDVQVGDTLDIFGGIELYSYSFVEQKTYPHVITKIDTLDDGRLQITSDAIVIFEDGEVGTFEEKQQQIWIEGLGSINGIVHTGINPGIAGNPAIVMLCAYRDDECVYKTDSNDPYWIDYTQLGCVYNEGDFIDGAFPMLSGLQRTICNEYCEDSKTSLQKFEDILFEHDKPYIYCESAFLIREENNKILIYSHSLDKDLVLYDFTLEVGDSLPRLYLDESAEKDLYWIDYNIMNVVDYHKDLEGNILPADTLIVTDVSAITLLDGKEYKKWTFNNGMEYVEGIGSYGNNMQFFDFFQLIGNMAVPVSLHGTHLVCVSKNGKLLYQMDDTEMERLGTECLCDYDSGHRKDNAKDGQIGGRPTPTQWNQLEVVLREMDNNHTILQAETFSYTLEDISQQVNNKTYFQLARKSTKDTATTKSVVGALHFGKDEDNRVYFLRDGVEYVLYDFTAEPGDTVEIFAGINNYPQETTYTHVVTGKDTLENGACRMLLEVVFPDETNTTAENAEKVWLAGLGSVDGIVHNAAKRTSNAHAAPSRTAHSSDTQTSVMLCAWREDSCLYTTDHPDYDSFGCVYNQDPTSVENTHSPLPMTNCQKIIRNEQLLILHEGKTYNVLGIAVE